VRREYSFNGNVNTKVDCTQAGLQSAETGVNIYKITVAEPTRQPLGKVPVLYASGKRCTPLSWSTTSDAIACERKLLTDSRTAESYKWFNFKPRSNSNNCTRAPLTCSRASAGACANARSSRTLIGAFVSATADCTAWVGTSAPVVDDANVDLYQTSDGLSTLVNMAGPGPHSDNRGKPFPEAQARCSALGGTVPSIYSEAQNEAVRQAAHRFPFVLGVQIDGQDTRMVAGFTGPDGLEQSYAAWIGASDGANDGEWKWQDGTLFTIGAESSKQIVTGEHGVRYTNWNDNPNFNNGLGYYEPNNLGGEDCVHMYSTGRWNDGKCTWTQPVVCDLPFTVVSTPRTFLEARAHCAASGKRLASIASVRATPPTHTRRPSLLVDLYAPLTPTLARAAAQSK
jgi:hypothetical protein